MMVEGRKYADIPLAETFFDSNLFQLGGQIFLLLLKLKFPRIEVSWPAALALKFLRATQPEN